MLAIRIAQWACGCFFLTALVTGIWKYLHIMRDPEAKAPVYVDISHRAAFMYSFACLTMAYFAGLSRWPAIWNAWGVGVAIFFFATAQSTYIIHGLLRDTENQLQRPHQLGKSHVPSPLIHGYMILLILGEIGGFLVVFTGAML
ncbi:MAG: hypothetical protein H6728_16405 [Myxococcales bacterium]|nr:hypothetical protein [Myxococcales bacterium]